MVAFQSKRVPYSLAKRVDAMQRQMRSGQLEWVKEWVKSETSAKFEFTDPSFTFPSSCSHVRALCAGGSQQ